MSRDELCGPPNAAVMGWTGFKGLDAVFMSPWSSRKIKRTAGWAPADSCYVLARGITEREGAESN